MSESLELTFAPMQPIAIPASIRAVALAFICYVALWTIINTVSNAGAFDHDMSEAYVWGREFQLGYFQHPPFWAWLAGIWFTIFPHAAWPFALLGAVNAGAGLLGVWWLSGCFAAGEKRLSATLLLLLTPSYTYLAYHYNANTIFLSLWPWTAFFFVRSLEGNRRTDAVLFGCFAGLGMLSKYSAIVLLGSCLLAAWAHPRRRAYFTSSSPYISIGLCAVLLLPHIWWLVKTGFLPFHYFASETGRTWFFALGQTLNMALAFIAVQIPIAFLIWIVLRQRPAGERHGGWNDPQLRLLAILGFAPILLTLAASIAFRVNLTTDQTVAVGCLVPLCLIQIAGRGDFKRLFRVTSRAVVGTSAVALLISPALAYAHLIHRSAVFQSVPMADQPVKELADISTRLWHQKTGLPLRNVTGSVPYADDIVFYSGDRPSEFVGFDLRRSLWITPEGLFHDGLLIVCAENDEQCRTSAASFASPQAQRIAVTLTHAFWNWRGPAKNFTLIIVPPQ